MANVAQYVTPQMRARTVHSRRTGATVAVVIALVLGLSTYASIQIYQLVRTSIGRSVAQAPLPAVSRQASLARSATLAASTPAPGTTAIPVGAPSASNQEANPADGAPSERINVLIMGIDQREGEQGPFRTDTMIVFTLDPVSGMTGMLSIPRDLWVTIPGYEENRINTANFLGDLKKYPGGGPALAKKTVAEAFGIPVHYYVRLNFEGFQQIIDTIGGIDIEVPKEIFDTEYPDEHYGYETLHIPAGLVHMDGELALKYARTRKTDSDIQRAGRQQQVIAAVKDKILTLNLLPSLLPKLPELSRTLSDSVETDMPLDVMLRLARLAPSLDLGDLQARVIDETMTIRHMTPQGADVLLPIRERIRPMIDELFWPESSTAGLPANSSGG